MAAAWIVYLNVVPACSLKYGFMESGLWGWNSIISPHIWIDVLDWFISTKHACMSSSIHIQVRHGRLVDTSYVTVHHLANLSILELPVYIQQTQAQPRPYV